MRDIAALAQIMRDNGIRRLRVHEASTEQVELELVEYWHPATVVSALDDIKRTTPGTPDAKQAFTHEDLENWSADE